MALSRLMLSVGFALALVGSAAADTIYVDDSAGGSGSGTSWQDAFPYLQDALAAAVVGDEIWVAAGTYRPDLGVGHVLGFRAETFQLRSGVSLLGGFDGTETLLSERAGLFDQTFLSGDLLGDDGPGFVNVADNSAHVLTGSGTDATAVLDGFTVQGGSTGLWGGGLVIADATGSPSLSNCTFRSNTAPRGGAVYARFSSKPTFTDCTFVENLGDLGGAVHNSTASPTFVRCTFRRNSAIGPMGGEGGAIHNDNNAFVTPSAVATLIDCDFIGNLAQGDGGAITNREDNGSRLVRCYFARNHSEDDGGAIYTIAGFVTAIDCTFHNNRASSRGGAVCNNRNFTANSPFSRTLMVNCAFTGNRAGSGAAGIWNSSTFSVLANCAFSGNACQGSAGGAVSSHFSSHLSILGCTFAGNTTTGDGGGLLFSESTGVFANTVLYGNSDPGGLDESAQIHLFLSTITIDHSCVQGWTGALGGVGNHGADPLFVDAAGPDGSVGTPDDDLRLGSGSPCCDAGDNARIPLDELDTDTDGNTSEPQPLDITGLPRRTDDPGVPDTGSGTAPIVDMGAYER